MNRMQVSVMIVLGSLLGFFLVGCGDHSTSSFQVKAGITAATSIARAFPDFSKSLVPNLEDSVVSGSPTEVNMKLYAAYLSANADCSGPFIQVADNGAAGSSFDFVANPTLIQANPAAGTYPCFIMRMSDVMTFRPDATAQGTFGADCTAGTLYSFDIHRTGETWKDKDGNDVPGTGDKGSALESSYTVDGTTINGVTIFMSTTPDSVVYAANATPITLTAPITITSATRSLNFLFDLNNKVSDSNNFCWLEAGNMTIQ